MIISLLWFFINYKVNNLLIIEVTFTLKKL